MHRQECRLLGLGKASTSAEFKSMELSLRQRQDGSFVDGYNHEIRWACFTSNRTNEPFGASVDAVFPIAKRATGQIGLHCPGNITVTANFLNRLHWIYVPAVLELIKELRRRPPNATLFETE